MNKKTHIGCRYSGLNRLLPSLLSVHRDYHKHENNQSGQVLVMGAFIILALTMVSITVANVGMMVAEKIHLQDTTDAAAYSAAVVEARYMNLNAYISRAMVANYDMMAFNQALWATVASHDHASAVVTAMLYQISLIVEVVSLGTATAASIKIDKLADAFRDYLHKPMHKLNQKLDGWIAQDEKDLNKYLENFNIYLLSVYEGLLFAAVQSARHEVISEVAEKMDPEVMMTTTLAVGSEAVSYDELARAVDFVFGGGRAGISGTILRRVERMTGDSSDPNVPYLLGTMNEVSMDKFAAGRSRDGTPDWILRQFNIGDVLRSIGALQTVERILHVACEVATLGFGDCDYDIRLDLGAVVRDNQEDAAHQNHVPFFATQRMREVNGWTMGLRIEGFGGGLISWALGQQGYTSGDRRNDVGNSANATASLEYGWPDCTFWGFLSGGLWGNDKIGGSWIQRWCLFWQSRNGTMPAWCAAYFDAGTRCDESLKAGTKTTNPANVPMAGLNSVNMRLAQLMGVTLPIFCDDHWDGTYDPMPVFEFEIWPPGLGLVESVKYLAKVIAERETEEGVPNYDFQNDLDDVGFAHYYRDDSRAGLRSPGNSRGSSHFKGPSLAAIGVKRASDINGLYGLGIGNDYDMTAISRAQVYYLNNPNRPAERPSLFNPHWGARLAPIEDRDSPQLLREGLPYVGSMGLPIRPTR